VKSAEEIMNILEAYDLTGSLRDAAELAGCSHHTVARYVAERERGLAPGAPARRPGVIDGFLPKLEELVERRGRSALMWRTITSPRWAMRGRSGPRGARSPG
jgi:hypothetical protein